VGRGAQARVKPHLHRTFTETGYCPFTDKKTNRVNKVSFSNHKKQQQFVNLQYKKLWWEADNRFVCIATVSSFWTIYDHR
jgi:hypothetical protein